MKKVLIVANNNLARGGIQHVIMSIAENLSPEYRFDVVCFSKRPGGHDSAFRAMGGEIHYIPRYEGSSRFRQRLDFYIRFLRIYFGIRRILRRGSYDVIHCHNGEESGICLLAAAAEGIPVRITHAHTAFDNYHQYNFIRKWYTDSLRRLIRKHATACVGCSEPANRVLYGSHPSQVIYNTIDFQRFDPKHYPVPGQHGSPVLVHVAGFCDNKNQLFSVEVLHALTRLFPDPKLILVGGDSLSYMQAYKREVEDKLKVYGLADRVTILPQDTDIPSVMAQADFLLFPSKREGLGTVAIEAQCLGLQCFVSDSVTKEVDCGGCVFLPLESGAPHWADAIAERFHANGGARGDWKMERFHTHTIMNAFKKLYDGAI